MSKHVQAFCRCVMYLERSRFECDICLLSACGQMEKRIQQIVLDSFGDQFYEKAIDCLKCLREQCIKVSLEYNDTLNDWRKSLLSEWFKDETKGFLISHV